MTEREKIRAQAAIAALPKCIDTVETVLLRGGRISCNSMQKEAAECAVRYADALVEALYKEEGEK